MAGSVTGVQGPIFFCANKHAVKCEGKMQWDGRISFTTFLSSAGEPNRVGAQKAKAHNRREEQATAGVSGVFWHVRKMANT